MEPFLPILKEIRAARQDLWLGANFLDQPGDVAFPVLGSLAANGVRIDAYWADDARIDERTANQFEARKIERIRQDSGWDGVYVGGVAFKKQRPVSKENYAGGGTCLYTLFGRDRDLGHCYWPRGRADKGPSVPIRHWKSPPCPSLGHQPGKRRQLL